MKAKGYISCFTLILLLLKHPSSVSSSFGFASPLKEQQDRENRMQDMARIMTQQLDFNFIIKS